MRFRFTIRDLLWLTLVVGMGIGWSIDRHRISRYWIDAFQEDIEGRDQVVRDVRAANELLRQDIAYLQQQLDSRNKELSRGSPATQR